MGDEDNFLSSLQAQIGTDSAIALHRLLGFKLVAISDGQCEISAIPKPEFYNGQQRVHGGFIASLCDAALGLAVQTKVGRGVGYGTVQLNINFIRKLDESVGCIVGMGHVIHSGRTMLTGECKVADARGKLYAHATGTFLVYPT